MTPDPPSRRALVASPTREQVARFARLTVEERYLWWSDTLLALFEMASLEARAAWRRHRSRDLVPGSANERGG